MSIGKRIRKLRKMRGWTQMQAANQSGFFGTNADGRITQYENETRTPQDKMLKALAKGFGVETYAIDVPNVDSYMGILQALFYLEDEYGLEIEKANGQAKLKFTGKEAGRLKNDLSLWLTEYEKLKNGEITEQEYDEWRYSYPAIPAKRNKDDIRKLREEKSDD